MATFLTALAIVAMASASADATPSHGECTNYLFRGLTRALHTGQTTGMLMDLEKIPQEVTCEAVQMFGDAIFKEFDRKGCSWGYDNQVFYERNLQYMGEFVIGECDIFGEITDKNDGEVQAAYDNIYCNVEEEGIVAGQAVANCLVPKVMGLGEGYEPGLDICADARTFMPCFEGLIDKCHSDTKASEALLDAVMAYVAIIVNQGFIREPEKTQALIDQFQTCSDADLGALARLKSVDLNYWPYGDMPSEREIIEAFSTGNTLEPNEERLKELVETMDAELAPAMGGAAALRRR